MNKDKAIFMNPSLAVALAEGQVEGTREEQLEAWQYLLDSGLVWQLQGWFGRTAMDLIEQGLIEQSA